MNEPGIIRVGPRRRRHVPLAEVGDRVTLELADKLRAKVQVDRAGRIVIPRQVADQIVRIVATPEVFA